ncbi:MAG: MoaF N-terminal domain-containing protein [Chloroflexota bacterium]|nr:MoaF N-terminal domain-containing protein [Chloroflexota bacterium]
MAADPLSGTTLRWTYSDGPMKGKGFEHRFGSDGRVSWKEAGDAKPSADSTAKYQHARVNDDVYVFSYLSGSGYTLTSVVDEKTGSVVSFASNEKELMVQHGTLAKGRS